MNRHELVARRLALGLSQSQLADVLPYKQSNLSQIERGLPASNPREMRPWFDERLSELEYTLNQLIDVTVTAVEAANRPVTLYVHDSDEALWAAHPEMDGIPAVLHQVAMARALWELRANGYDVEINAAP